MKRYVTSISIFALLSGICVAQPYRQLAPPEVGKRLLPQFEQLAHGFVTDITYAEIKEQRQRENNQPWPELRNKDSLDVLQKTIAGLGAGDPEIPVTVYMPKSAVGLPVFIWFHGGGFVYGTPKSDHRRCATYATQGRVIVVNVDYRLAPENPFPAALHDAYAVLLWVQKNASCIGGNAERIAVGGCSAGAGIAGSLSQYARDQNGPKISLQVLEIVPGDAKVDYPSTIELLRVPGLKGEDIPILMDFYVGKNGHAGQKYVLPGNIDDVSKLPPTLICVAGTDPLRDSGITYADRLIKAGNLTELHVFAGYAHGMPLPESFSITIRMMKQFLK